MTTLSVRASVTRASATLFSLQFVLLDACTRRAAPTPSTYVGWLGSVAFWMAVVWLLGRARRATKHTRVAHGLRALVAAIASFVFVTQATGAIYFGAPLNGQSLAAARAAWGDVARVLSELRTVLGIAMLVVGALSFTLLWLARNIRVPRLRWQAGTWGLAALFFALGAPSPDVALVRGIPSLRSETKIRAAHAVQIPELPSSKAELPDVLFVITESVRHSDVCDAPDAPCHTMPELFAFAPDRVDLREMRSLASYTTIAVGGLLTGREQLGDHPTLAAMPLAFDFAKAARSGTSKYFVAYYGAQISTSVFERGTIASATDSMVDLESLLGRAVEDEDQVLDMMPDRLLADRFVRDIEAMPSPRFIVLHLLGTHAPYAVDEARAPFTPYRRSVSWAHMDELHRAYKNAIVAQDHELTRMLKAFETSERGRPWVLTYTSDHGEAFGEHGAIHHGQNVYPEQVHVPSFVLARGQALSSAQMNALRAHASEPLTHADLLPSVLDAIGIWSSLPILPHVKGMAGQSLLQSWTRPRGPIALTNCNGSFRCPLNNWGMLGNRAALVSQAWDGGWKCITLSGEGTPEGDACDELKRASRTPFPRLPNGEENR